MGVARRAANHSRRRRSETPTPAAYSKRGSSSRRVRSITKGVLRCASFRLLARALARVRNVSSGRRETFPGSLDRWRACNGRARGGLGVSSASDVALCYWIRVKIWRLSLALGALAPTRARAADEYREVPSPTPEEVIAVARGDAAWPEVLKQRNAGKRLEGKYIVYCARSGDVVRVEPEQAIAGADGPVVAYLKARHFPFTRPVRFELWVSLEFEADKPAAPPPAPPAPPPPPPPPPTATAPPKKYRAVALPALEQDALDVAPPQLKMGDRKGGSGAYMIFVEPDGTVSRVEVVQSVDGSDQAIMARLRSWRFKPQRERVRSVVRFSVSPSGIERF
jgi:hypothetical protein